MSCSENEMVQLKSFLNKSKDTIEIHRSDTNKLIMNYLVTEGFKEAAEKFQAEAGFRTPVDFSALDTRILIRKSIQEGNVQEAIRLVNQLHPELLDNDRYLYFQLQQLHLIELIRAGKDQDALTFAQTQLSEAGETNPDVLVELERTLALLAFEDPDSSPFGGLLDLMHREKVANEINTAIIKIDHEAFISPKLSSILKLILWAQDVLDKNKIEYSKMTDLGSATLEKVKEDGQERKSRSKKRFRADRVNEAVPYNINLIRRIRE